MRNLLIVWFLNALSLLALPYLLPGISIRGLGSALIVALVLGLINAVVRPVLVVLTLPVTILTLGLFIFVINALLFWLAAELVPGFAVSGFWPALFGSVVYSLISWLLTGLFFPRG